jgi:hypothetical protein
MDRFRFTSADQIVLFLSALGQRQVSQAAKQAFPCVIYMRSYAARPADFTHPFRHKDC